MIPTSDVVPTCPNLSRPMSQPQTLFFTRCPNCPNLQARAHAMCSSISTLTRNNTSGVDGWDGWDMVYKSTTYLSQPSIKGLDRLGHQSSIQRQNKKTNTKTSGYKIEKVLPSNNNREQFGPRFFCWFWGWGLVPGCGVGRGW